MVGRPDYVWVSVDARVKVSPGAEHDRVKDEVERKISDFMHPLWGGHDGNGWPFGRGMFLSELYSQIQSVRGVEYTEGLAVFPVDPSSGERIQTPGSQNGNMAEGNAPGLASVTTPQTISVPPSGILCSWYHNIVCF